MHVFSLRFFVSLNSDRIFYFVHFNKLNYDRILYFAFSFLRSDHVEVFKNLFGKLLGGTVV